MTARRHKATLRAILLASIVGSLLAAFTGSAPAFAGSVWWKLDSTSAPSNLPPGGEGQIVVSAGNLGNATAMASEAHPIKILDRLPAGLSVTSVTGYTRKGSASGRQPTTALTCPAGPTPTCELTSSLAPYE